MAEYAVIHSKLPKPLHAKLIAYCKHEGIKPYGLIRQLVAERVDELVPIHRSGINVFVYCKKSDTFCWEVRYDNGEVQVAAESLSPQFIENVSSALLNAISDREGYVKKKKKSSVAIPHLKRLSEVKRHA